MQSKLYQKCMQNGAEIVCKNSVQIVLQKLHFFVSKKCCKVMQMNTLRVFPRARVNKQTNKQNTLRCYGKDV